MKNIFEIMKEYGLELPEDKKKDFEKSLLDNYKTISDYENQKNKLEQANDTIKANDSAMKDLQKKLDEFQDVDVSGLNQRIEDLEKEKKTIEADYQRKLADRDFSDILKDSISAAQGKNVKAITALLDVDTLRKSKNQKEDIAAAIKDLTEAEDSKMLFGCSDPKPTGTGSPIGNVGTGIGIDADTEQMRSAMGLSATGKDGDK